MKSIQVIVRTPSTHDWAPRFIKRSLKNSGKIQILKLSKTQYLYYVSPSGLFQYKAWRLWLQNLLQECQKCLSDMTSHYAHIQWGMMLIFNPIQDLHPSDTYTEKKLKSDEKNFSYHLDTNRGRMDGQTDGRTDGQTDEQGVPSIYKDQGSISLMIYFSS